MAECPFCQAEVDENLTIYGGTCPHCFGEIPGEEAPTDPGEEVRAQQEAQDRRGLWLRRMALIGSVAALTCAGIIVGTAVVFWPQKPLPVIDFDDAEFYQPVELVAYVEPPAEEATEGGHGGHTSSSSHRPVGASLQGFSLDGLGEDDLGVADMGSTADVRAADGVGTRSGTADQDIGDLEADLSTGDVDLGGGVDLGGMEVGVSRRFQKGVRITDDAAIIDHLRMVMKHEIPKLNQCYERVLKSDPDVQGRWRLDFTVGREGDVIAVDVKGRDVSQPEFEKCLADKIYKWHFQPLKADQPVGKTITFRPG